MHTPAKRLPPKARTSLPMQCPISPIRFYNETTVNVHGNITKIFPGKIIILAGLCLLRHSSVNVHGRQLCRDFAQNEASVREMFRRYPDVNVVYVVNPRDYEICRTVANLWLLSCTCSFQFWLNFILLPDYFARKYLRDISVYVNGRNTTCRRCCLRTARGA